LHARNNPRLTLSEKRFLNQRHFVRILENSLLKREQHFTSKFASLLFKSSTNQSQVDVLEVEVNRNGVIRSGVE
jgi:hypothetical protein